MLASNVIVVGGGVAGIAAAIELSKNRAIHVTLLEARDRLGGRILTHRTLVPASLESSNLVPQGSSNIAFDFGASWIHGVDPTNPLFPLLKTGHVEYVHTDSDLMFLQPGQPPLQAEESDHYWKVVWDILDKAQVYATEHREQISPDMSFRQWLTEHLEQHLKDYEADIPDGYLRSDELRRALLGLSMYWADENAIPLERVSMKYMDAENVFPGDHCLVTNGYDRVIKALTSELKNARVLLEHAVDKIDYNESMVRVSTKRGTFTADAVLLTLPLGVLKSQSSTLFSPPLPLTKQLAIERLSFGTMFKIVLFFPVCFWPKDKHFINFLPSSITQPDRLLMDRFNLNADQRKALATYMLDLANYSSLMPVYNIPILIGYATNLAAELMERLSDQDARMVYVCQLAHYYGILASTKKTEGEMLWPKVSFMSRWHQDPFARGSYTSIAVGASPSDLQTFETPVGARSYEQMLDDDDYEHEEPIHNCAAEVIAENAATATLTSIDDPMNGRVFFAGEHTSVAHFASVQGALMTGRREAAKILGQVCQRYR
ncbi:hypothetical protein BGZ98_007773 [Dissophora globulifera]|nr:hypothetical protein BGZ98_007773 [Dissophora globulifera]